MNDLTLWAEFTHTGLTPMPWKPIISYTSSGSIVATPSTPPWPPRRPDGPTLDRRPRYACHWAGGTTNATAATTALTTQLYNTGHYNGGYHAFTDAGTDSNGNLIPLKDGFENFHLQGFLNSGLTAQCDDFADFLVCLSNGIGALNLQAQRSATAADIIGNYSGFTTNPITAAPIQVTPPATGGTATPWAYHQWAASAIFDGCLRFNGTTSPINMALTNYFNALVATLNHNYQPTGPHQDWNPQPAFTPAIVN